MRRALFYLCYAFALIGKSLQKHIIINLEKGDSPLVTDELQQFVKQGKHLLLENPKAWAFFESSEGKISEV
jgi:hypothetical protein